MFYSDKAVPRELKTCKKNLAVTCINYKKALNDCLAMFGVAENVRNFICNSMKKWNIEPPAAETVLGEFNIKRGIFRGDSFSALVFVLGLTAFNLVFRKAGYEFKKLR